jgi:hypothetical protein
MRVRSCLLLLFFLLAFSYGKPVDKTKKTSGKSPAKAPKVQSNTDALKYFDQFGYNKCGGHGSGKVAGEEVLCQSSLSTMLEHFQTVYHLPVTGKLDTPTVTQMNKPRCSLGDYPLAYSAVKPW